MSFTGAESHHNSPFGGEVDAKRRVRGPRQAPNLERPPHPARWADLSPKGEVENAFYQ